MVFVSDECLGVGFVLVGDDICDFGGGFCNDGGGDGGE